MSTNARSVSRHVLRLEMQIRALSEIANAT
jgi:hypothetical protein